MIAAGLVGVDAAADAGNDVAAVDAAAVGGDDEQHDGDGVEAGGYPMTDALASPALVD